MEKYELTYRKLLTKREFNVRKANALIQKSRYELSLQEQKIILSLIQMIKPDDDKLMLYEFKIKEFCELCGIDETSGKNYRYVKETLKKLTDRSYWITLEDGTETVVRWVEKPYINKHSGTIRIKLDEDMKPFLLNIKKYFTQYSLYHILPMKSQYSVRVYELLRSYLNLHEYECGIEELKIMLQCQHYVKFSDFKSRVLEQALGEINKFGDISVAYELIKDGHKYSRIIFTIDPKEMTEKFEAWDNIWRRLSPKQIDGQISFFNNEIDT